MTDEYARQFRDLGELSPTIRLESGVGPRGVEPLAPNDDESHITALEQIRTIIDEHYGDSIERLCGDDQELIIERAVFLSDNVPYIEYQIVEEADD